MAVTGPGPNRYYKKVDTSVTRDTNLSGVYKDVFDGNTETATIAAAQDPQYYLSDVVIPDSHSFGNSRLVGMKQYYYPTSVDITDKNYLPGMKLWKVNGHIGEDNEGTLTVNKRNLTVITANQDLSTPWLYDQFNAGSSTVETIRGSTSTTVYSSGTPYITIEDALTYQNGDLSRADMIERYSEPHFTSNGTQDVIFITKKRQFGNSMVSDGSFATTAVATTVALVGTAVASMFSWAGGAVAAVAAASTITYAEEWTPTSGQDFWVVDVYFKDVPSSALKYIGQTTQTGEDSKATAINSDISKTVIDRIDSRGNKPIFDNEDNQMFTATGIFSPKKYLNGGQSLKLTTFWDKSIIPGRNSSSEYIHSSYMGLAGFITKNRQEVKAIIEIPATGINIDTAGSKTMRLGDLEHSNLSVYNYDGTLDYLLDNGFGYTQPVISTDIMIDEMSPIFRAKSGAHTTSTGTTFAALGDCAWLRGMAITFSRSKPTEDESFYNFMVRTTSSSKSVDLAEGQDRRNHADSLDDAAEYGTASGIIIGKIPINFASEGIKAIYNDDKQFIPDYPIMAIPFGSKYDSFTTAASNRWKTSNLNGKSDGDGACFHESTALGNTVWYDPFNDAVPKNGVVLDEQAWYNVRVNVNHRGMSYIIRDSATGEYVTKENISFNTGQSDYTNAPRYMTIWNFNFPGAGLYSTDPDEFAMNGLGHTDTDGVLDFDTGNTIYVDNIALVGFNHTHSNSTVSYNNPSRGKINIAPTTTNTTALDSEDDRDVYRTVPSNTYVSFGFDTLAEFDRATSSAQHNLFFNTIAADSTMEAIHHDADDLSIRAGFTSNSVSELIGAQATHSFFEYKGTPTDADTVNGKFKGLSTLGVANRGLDFDGDTQVDNFSKKGAVILNFNSQTANLGTDAGSAQAAPAKRENIFTSARILDYSGSANGEVVVDSASLFNLDDDCDYVIYRRDLVSGNTGLIGNQFSLVWTDAPTNDFGVVAKVIKRQGGSITFDKDLTITDLGHQKVSDGTMTLEKARTKHPLCGNKYRNVLYISPMKYWITMEIKNTSNVAGTRGANRSYETVCMVNQGTTPPATADFGATFSEFKYTDAGNYLKGWNLYPSIDNTLVETQVDYGNGIMDAEKGPNAGFVDKVIVEQNSADYDKWLVFDSSSVITEDKIKEGQVYTSLITAVNPLSTSSVIIATDENDDKIVSTGFTNTKRPMTLAIFEDDVPVISDFSVRPNETNPFYPEFSWTCSDDDTWYGFLIIDTEIPSHQYHKSSLHLPMWRPLPSSENRGMNWPPANDDSEMDIIDYHNNESYPYGYYRHLNSKHGKIGKAHLRPSTTTDKGTHTSGTIKDYTSFLDPEGLSGWCHNFDGTDRIIVYAPAHSGSGDASTSINGNQSSFILHIRPDKYPDLQADIMHTGGAGGIDLFLESDGKISAKFFYSKTEFVELTSHSIAPLNGNPTNIIVTFDRDLTHGNCKLFLNGKLEDQSGRILNAGSSTRWKTNYSIEKFENDGMGYLWTLGYGYDGKMEELVYYPHTIYPINPADGTFIYEKPVAEIDSNGKPISYFARLFVKDYHNIRGTSVNEVAMSSPLTIHKAGVEL